MTQFREVFRFEVRHQLRQPATWLYLALVLGLAVLRADATDVGTTTYHAPVNAAGSTLLVGILATLVTAGIFVDAGQRDRRWRMDPLLYTAPLRRRDYLGGRFLGALAVNAAIFLAIPAGLLLGVWLFSLDPKTLGTARLEAYALPFIVYLLPNLLVNAAVLFGVTVLSGRALPGYLAALGLTAFYLFAGLSGTAESSAAASLLDPMGAVELSRQTAGWTRVELNTRLIEPRGMLLWNRLLWTGLAAAMLGLTLWRFHPAHTRTVARTRTRRVEAAPAEDAARAVIVPAAPRSFGAGARARQALAVAGMGIRQTVLTRDFLLICIGLVIFALMMVMESAMSGTPRWPLTHEVAADLTSRVMQILVALLTVFYAGELVWRERDARMEKIGDSVPMPDWVPFAGKLLALATMLIVLQAVLMAAGMLSQAVQGWSAFRPGVYLQVLFGLRMPDYLLFAVLALLAHVLVNHKYLGHLVGALALVGILMARRLGIEHNLLVYASDAGWRGSDLNGFGPFVAPFVWFKLYWAAWAMLLAMAGVLFWVRGTEDGPRRRLRMARMRITPHVAAGSAAAALLVLGTGGFVFYNTNVRNEYRTARQAEDVSARYERRYKRFENAPQPRLTDVRLRAELHPERRRASIRGSYRLVNRTASPIASIHLSSLPTPGATLRGIRFDRAARVAVDDDAHGFRTWTLDRPLQSGDSVRMEFELDVAPRGFRNREEASSGAALVGDFTSLGSWLLPAIGYLREMELSSPEARRAHGLPPSDVRPSIHDTTARRIPRIAPHAEWIRFEAVIGTAPGHTAVVPGTLQRSWTEGGRRWFHYRGETPILNFFALTSARYAERRARWTGASGEAVEIRVLHHPDHAFNVDRMIRGARAALDYYTARFGPYPHRELRLTEYPRYGSFARAYAGHIVYSEDAAMTLARIGDDEALDDPALLTVAHEIGHQWWGQQVMGADVQGSQMLSETLAQYGAAMVARRVHGPRAARRFVRAMHERYLFGRGRHATPEAPLLLTTDHSYLHYGKGAAAMYALQDYVGEERINMALRRMVQRHGKRGPPYPTTLDLYRELQAVTPDSLRYLLHDLLATTTLWDLQATGARAAPAGGGAYRVSLDVDAAKLRSDSVGNHTAVPMDDLVEVGVFAAPGEPLYLSRHRVRSGRQTITVTVPGRPARAAIDPYHTLIVRHQDAVLAGNANFAEVEIDDAP